MNLEDIILSDISQSLKIKTTSFHLYEVPKIDKFINSKSRTVMGLDKGKMGSY